MITWKKQGEALVGSLLLKEGGRASVVLVGAVGNAKGAALMTPGDDPKRPHTAFLPEGCDHLTPGQYLEILCMQERGFGNRAFPAPTGLD